MPIAWGLLGIEKVCIAVSISKNAGKNDAALKPQSYDDLMSGRFWVAATRSSQEFNHGQMLKQRAISLAGCWRVGFQSLESPSRREDCGRNDEMNGPTIDAPLMFASSAGNFGVCKSDGDASRRKGRRFKAMSNATQMRRFDCRRG